jgi:adenylate kinase
MRPLIVALTGIPGVGKSTFLTALSSHLEFLPLQASELIQSAREHSVAHDSLRYADLDENQQLLIQGFEARIIDATNVVILDAHSVIERDSDFIRIDPAVFEAIGICAMIFLMDDPAAILTRRNLDVTRKRPKKSVDSLKDLQAIAWSHATDICRLLQVPLHKMATCDIEHVCNILRVMRDSNRR